MEYLTKMLELISNKTTLNKLQLYEFNTLYNLYYKSNIKMCASCGIAAYVKKIKRDYDRLKSGTTE